VCLQGSGDFPHPMYSRSRVSVAVSSARKSPLRMFGWILIVAASLMICVELLLRFGLGLGNPVVLAADSACGYILAPNQNTYRFFCRTRTDQYGMRSDRFAPIPAAGTLRVLFIGDSVTYGTSHVDQSRIFTELLHRELPAVVHRPVEVLNASASAWAIDNELSWLHSRGTFHAKLVFLVLNNGDLGQPRAEARDVGDDLAQNHPMTAIGEVWARFLKPRLFRRAAHIDAGDVQTKADALMRANLADMDRFQQIVSANGARMAVLYIPFRHDVPAPANQAEVAFSEWSAAHHVPFFDMTAVEAPFSAWQIAPDGDHLNDRGHQLIAQEVEKEWISKLGQ
jgi:hypothetical protein